MLRNKIYISIQIQHLLKLNKFSATATNEPKLIQIQHLLKLNLLVEIKTLKLEENSNTTLVKVKFYMAYNASFPAEFKYNTC